MKETDFEKKVMREVSLLPNSYWSIKEPRSSVKGAPDRQGCINGRFIALEIKRSLAAANKKSSTISMQRYTLDKIRLAGGYAQFVYPENWELIYGDLRRMAYE